MVERPKTMTFQCPHNGYVSSKHAPARTVVLTSSTALQKLDVSPAAPTDAN